MVTVASNTNGRNINIGDVEYTVIRPPKPTIEAFVGGKPYTGTGFVPKRSGLQIRIKPNADFRSALPKDARYGISGAEVLAQLSLGPPKSVNKVRGINDAVGGSLNVPLGQQVAQARAGTTVFVRLDEVYRINFAGKKVKEGFNELERTIKFNVK